MAREQSDAKLFLQQPNLTTQSGLRDVHSVCGLAQASEFGNMDHGTKLAEFHDLYPLAITDHANRLGN
jgi:hypothetical protein